MAMLKRPVKDRSVWYGTDFTDDDSWIETLNNKELAEIGSALAAVETKGLGLGEFSREDFLLPTLGRRLEKIIEELEEGRGFVLLRGLPVEKYSLDQMRLIYWGIGSYFGRAVAQNNQGDIIANVKNLGVDYSKPEGRGYTSNANLRFHNDGTDVVALLCWRRPKFGGTSIIASASAIYNQVLEDKPQYLEELYKGYRYFLRGEGASDDPNEITVAELPIFSYYKDKLSTRFNPKMILGAEQKSGVMLEPVQWEAIQYIEALAASPEFRHSMALQPGDIQFLNNHCTYHSREAFVDGENENEIRHLLRLWLYLYDGRELAPGFGNRYNTGEGGGMAVKN